MDATHRLIERVRSALPTHSNYAVAKALQMPQHQLSDVLKKKYGLGPKAVIRISEILQIDVRDVLVLIEEDKARTPDDKEFWGRRSPRVSAALAFAGLAFVAALIHGSNAQASCVYTQAQCTNVYIMRSTKTT